MNSGLQLFIIQVIFMLILLFVIVILFRERKAIQVEKRIGRYSIDSVLDNSPSFFNKASFHYQNLIQRLRKYTKKSGFAVRLSKKYDKYTTYMKNMEAIDFVTNKTLISIGFVMLTIFSQILQMKVISLWEMLLNMVLGFYILDIYLIYNHKRKVKLIENEMLRAVIIMNNAFKAGKSTIQAVEIASKELPEPICDEFKRIHHELKYGLSVDTVFDRFAKRVNIEEARYLSSSLTILNKTGGNIVKVFSSIEKTLFDKKKLNEELKNLTVSSNLIVKVLLFVPFLFSMVIYFLNPTYFNPLFTSPLGYAVLILIILIFILYVFFLQKIMKVKV